MLTKRDPSEDMSFGEDYNHMRRRLEGDSLNFMHAKHRVYLQESVAKVDQWK